MRRDTRKHIASFASSKGISDVSVVDTWETCGLVDLLYGPDRDRPASYIRGGVPGQLEDVALRTGSVDL